MPGKRQNADLAASALAAGRTTAEAATAAGCSERTVANWKKDPWFAARVAELRATAVGEASGKLASSMSAAADVLRDLLDNADPNVRHKSAVKLLELGLKVGELVDLQRRVEDLERRLSTMGMK